MADLNSTSKEIVEGAIENLAVEESEKHGTDINYVIDALDDALDVFDVIDSDAIKDKIAASKEEARLKREEAKRIKDEAKAAALAEKERLKAESEELKRIALEQKEAAKKALQEEREAIKAQNLALKEAKLAEIKAANDAKELEKEKERFKKKVVESLTKDNKYETTSQNRKLGPYKNAFTAIVAVLEARDDYTAHHSERVTIMCENFCKVLGLPSAFTTVATTAASIHDIGKAGIQDSTLKKPGALDDDQWDEMKSHCLIGMQIITKAGEDLEYIAQGILAHHERWDGTGYPMKLEGEEIPYMARLIAICDSTDAMLSSRCYRRHLTEDICIEELIKNKGKMYQPELVDIFVDNWDEIVGDLYEEVE